MRWRTGNQCSSSSSGWEGDCRGTCRTINLQGRWCKNWMDIQFCSKFQIHILSRWSSFVSLARLLPVRLFDARKHAIFSASESCLPALSTSVYSVMDRGVFKFSIAEARVTQEEILRELFDGAAWTQSVFAITSGSQVNIRWLSLPACSSAERCRHSPPRLSFSARPHIVNHHYALRTPIRLCFVGRCYFWTCTRDVTGRHSLM